MALERMNYSEGQEGGKMMPGQNDIVMAIREAFDQLRFFYRAGVGRRVWVPWQEDPLEGQNGWTTAVKTALCRVGREQFGFSVGCHGVPAPEVADYGEWLWDISWCREGAQGRLVDLPLVAECEWTLSSAAIIEDFQKLLVACAGVRLMIHEHWTDREEIPDPPAMANHLSEHIQAYQRTQPNAVYLLIALDGTQPEYESHNIRYFSLGTKGAAVEWGKRKPFPPSPA